MTALDQWCETHGATYSARWEFEQVINLALNVPLYGRPHTVLELGAHAGASLAVWKEAFLDPSFLIGVEAEDSPRTRAGLDPLEAAGACIIYGKTYAPETFRQVIHTLDGLWIDFLYIDGDHRFEHVGTDFEMYAPLVRDGGLIVLDDAITRNVKDTEVYKYVDVLRQRGPTNLIYGGGDSGGKLVIFR
jgi:cephalosporin hydroxylase